MKDTIIINLPCSQHIGLLGNAGEHNTTELIFNLDDKLSRSDYINVEFENDSHDKTTIEDLQIENGQIKILLNHKITQTPGRVKIQLIGYRFNDSDDVISIIDKSNIMYGNIAPSINGIDSECNPEPSFMELLWAKVRKLWDMRHSHHNQEILDQITEDGLGGGGNLPVAHINDEGELIFELAEGITDADINQYGELELTLETEDGEEAINLGKVKGRTPEFRLTEKLLELKYDDETVWNTLVDFSTIASSFDLRLNEETLFLEAKRDVNAEWEQVADLSELAKAHEHPNKDVLDKITGDVFENISDAVSKRHTHENIDTINQITDEHIENIDKIPEIEEDVAELINNPTKQLVEGMFYTDETKKGLSANKNAVPTADNVWIEGNASNYHSFDELMSSATLNVVTSTVNKSTTTTVTINIVCINSDSASFVKNTLSSGGYHMGVVFEDTPDKSFYIKISSATISNTTVSVEFTFIDGQETFPITGNITRVIQSLYTYPKNGVGSHIEGLETIAAGDYSHVQGKYNEIDTEGKYAHIVGNGTGEDNRSNAHTLDWEGNAWYAGKVTADGIEVLVESDIVPIVENLTVNSATLKIDIEPLKIDAVYRVVVDGVEYERTVSDYEAGGGQYLYYIGNLSLSLNVPSTMNTGENFCIIYHQDFNYSTVSVRELGSTLSLYGMWSAISRWDLVSYIDSLDTGLTEEQAADLAANTEARHEHENKDILDLIGLGKHGNLTVKTETGSESILWNTHNGSVIEGYEIDEETGDITLFVRLVPNPAIPAEEIKIKQSLEIPLVTELPTNAKFGDMCLYARANNLSTDDTGKTIYIDPEWLNKIGTETGATWYWNFYSKDYSNGFFIAIESNETVDYSQSVSFSAYTYNWGYHLYFKRDTDGKLVLNTSANNHYTTGNDDKTPITEMPKSLEIPQFDGSGVENSSCPFTVFYHEPKLMIYRNEWAEVSTGGGDTEEIWQAIEDIQGGIDEIETTATETTVLQANKFYSFGVAETLTLEFAEGEADKVNEYLFSFVSGTTATVLTLPSSVQWVNELTVEANKRYEISVVDNIALWCAVDYTAEVTE